MGKGRAPCCEKVGLKRGPWTPAEDMRLIAYIQKFGHGNWRALPKQAGLLRCGKSCRLRWINYLRPDIKRGNFTQEEEETIIRLHNSLGNKWSKIACQLPGRTDNEIKNVWNTHLKKKLSKKEATPTTSKEESKENSISTSSSDSALSTRLNQGDGIGDDGQINSIFDVDNSSNTNDLIEEKKKDDPLEVPIEIPLEPNIDIWDMLDDGTCNTSLNKQFKSKESNYGTADEPKPSLSSSPTSSTSSTDNSCGSCLSQLADDQDLLVLFGEKDHDQSDEIMNLSDEYNMDLWDMLNGDGPGLMENSVGQERELQALNAAKEEGESKEAYDEKRWLMDLEYDLELKALSDEHQSSLTAVSNEPQDFLPTYDGTQELDVDPIVAYFQMHPSSPICLEMSWSN